MQEERSEAGEGLRGVETNGLQQFSCSKTESFIMQPRRKKGWGPPPSVGTMGIITISLAFTYVLRIELRSACLGQLTEPSSSEP